MNLLSFLTNKKIFKIISYLIRFYLVFFYRIKVGDNFYCENFPKLKINGLPANIEIGSNVSILGSVDLRNRENGKIIIEDNVMIEDNCRFVAARESLLKIGFGTKVTANAVWNAGSDIIVGNKCIFAMRSAINSNEHMTLKKMNIQDQGFEYGNIKIGNDCLVGVNVSINKGVHIADGSIIGANSVVTKDTIEFSVNAGVPAKLIKYRQ